MGEMDRAREIIEFLKDKDADLATKLDLYMDKVESPRILFSGAAARLDTTCPSIPQSLLKNLNH